MTNQPDNANQASRAVDNNADHVLADRQLLPAVPDAEAGHRADGVVRGAGEAGLGHHHLAQQGARTSRSGWRSALDSPIEETKVIGVADLSDGQTQIQLNEHEPTAHVLIWITQLSSSGGGKNQSEIREIVYTRAQ